MGLMKKALNLDSETSSSLLRKALALREQIARDDEREPVSADSAGAFRPTVAVLDDVKKKPFQKSYRMAA